ncbi:hypothetical protein [Nonomuraea sp. NPDC049158]|uniref:hypothetical protein n=1 Tax=Nonomuraea sp. NPDC049158 TaxID=3155649 RepID=UPI0033CB34EF
MIAVALATKTAEGLAEGRRAAFEALVGLVPRKFEGRDSAQSALADDEADPERRHRLRRPQANRALT